MSGPTLTPSSVPRPTFSAPIRPASLLGELLRDRLVDVEAVGRRARLAAVAHLGQQRALDRRVEVGVLEDEERRVAAELHRDLQHLLGGLLDQLRPTSVEPVNDSLRVRGSPISGSMIDPDDAAVTR